jgi:hypothetical protein
MQEKRKTPRRFINVMRGVYYYFGFRSDSDFTLLFRKDRLLR